MLDICLNICSNTLHQQRNTNRERMMQDIVNKADGWDYLLSVGFSAESARYAFEMAPKAILSQIGSNEKGNAFIIPKWRRGDLEHFASQSK